MARGLELGVGAGARGRVGATRGRGNGGRRVGVRSRVVAATN